MAGARVDLESSLVSGEDVRAALLAESLGLADPLHVIGVLARVWKACTECQSYTLSQAVVRQLLGRADAVQCLLDADLAELVADHMPTRWAAELGARAVPARPGEQVVRLRGTAGRIEWYGRLRALASAGGRARASGAERDAKGKLQHQTSSQQAGSRLGAGWLAAPAVDQPGVQPASSQSPAPSEIPDLRSQRSDARGLSTNDPQGVTVDEVIGGLEEVRERLATARGEVDIPPIAALARLDLLDVIEETQATSVDVERALQLLEHSARSAAAADVGSLTRLLRIGGRAGPRRVELVAVRDDRMLTGESS